MIQLRNVENFQSLAIHHECVAELNGDSARIVQMRARRFPRRRCGFSGSFKSTTTKPAIAKHVSVRSGDGDAPRAIEDAAGIESQRALQEIVARIAIEQRADAGSFAFWIGIANDHEALVFVRDV